MKYILIIVLILPLLVYSQNNYSLFFDSTDGDSDHVAIADGIFDFGTNDFSISFWVKSSATGGTFERILGQRENSQNYVEVVLHEPDGDVEITVESGNVISLNIVTNSTSDVFDGNWHFIVFSCPHNNNSGNLAYKDGVVFSGFGVQSNTSDTKTISSTEDCYIGQRGDDADWLEGTYVDELIIWNKALTEAEQLDLYNNGLPKDQRSTIGVVNYWRFEEGAGSTVNDYVGSNDGTITNATYSSDNPGWDAKQQSGFSKFSDYKNWDKF